MPSRYGLDPITELGFRLRQPIPTGADFEPWAFKVKGPKGNPSAYKGEEQVRDYQSLRGIACVLAALRDAGYQGGELQVAFAELSRGRWAPSTETLGVMAGEEIISNEED